MEKAAPVMLRPIIVGTLVVCLAVAIAPWMSGGQEPLAVLVSGFVLLLGAILAWRQPQVRQLRRGPLVVAFVALIGFALLSLLWSANRYSTMVWVAHWMMAGLAFRLAYTVAGESRGREWVLRAYLASAAVFCGVALVMYVTGTYDRLTGSFYWPNPAAAYLIPAIVLAVERLRLARGKRVWLWGSAAVLFLGSFLLTDSRATTLVLMIVGAIYLLIMRTNRAFWIRFVVIGAMGWGLSIGLVRVSTLFVQHSEKMAPGSRLAEVAGGESRSLNDRFSYLRSAFEMWWAHPVGGTGAETYGDVHPQYQPTVVNASTDAHNIYVQTLAELGLVGAVALAAVLLWLLAGSLRGLVAEPETVPIVLGAGGLLLHFGLDIDTRYPALLMLAAALFGLVYRQWGQRRRGASWRWPAVAALTLVPLISLYQSDAWAVRARAAQDDGDYATAAQRFAVAHQGVVFNPDYVNAEGIDLYTEAAAGGSGATGLLALALDRARQAQALDPHDGQHHQLEGRVLVLRGDMAGAAAAFRAALKLDPHNHPDYALDLAAVQLRVGDAVGAVATAQAMLAQYPQAVIDNRNMDETLRPSLANLEALVGNADLAQGRLDEARAAAKRALQLDAKNLRGRALRHQVDERVRLAL
jgi:O-antigen ligase